MSRQLKKLPDIKPRSPGRLLNRTTTARIRVDLEAAAPVLGLSVTFIRRVIGAERDALDVNDVLRLLDTDEFCETFVPRSKIIEYFENYHPDGGELYNPTSPISLLAGNAGDVLARLPSDLVDCMVTSPPYWGMRLYDEPVYVNWADGEFCPLGHEQTPEGYIRHSVEILHRSHRILAKQGSIWWNVMDTFNTRTQIRSNAAEALRAMQGKDKTAWHDYDCRRYSAGHAFLKDGEQCQIPARITERASRIGFYAKSVITWAKTGSLPEPQNSRVSRSLEYILHFSKQRTPYFDKEAYRKTPPRLGGRNSFESDKLSDVWLLPTTAGKNGHGAQFALALPGRCISLSTPANGIVFDPFAGCGTTGVAAVELQRRFIGCDVSAKYLEIARRQIDAALQATGKSALASLLRPHQGQLLNQSRSRYKKVKALSEA